MDEQPTTGSTAAPASGADQALPEQADQETAAPAPSAPNEDSSQSAGEQDSLPETDDKLKGWAESKGISLDSDSAIRAAKIAMDSQADFQRTRQEASQLKKSMTAASDQQAEELAVQTGQDPELLQRLHRMEVKQNIRDFWDEHPEARQLEGEMSRIVQGKPHLVHDLEAVYALAQMQSSSSIKSEGGREALQALANKQRTAAPSGAAVSSAINSTPTVTRAVIAQKTAAGDVNWLNKNQTKINQMVADGTLQ